MIQTTQTLELYDKKPLTMLTILTNRWHQFEIGELNNAKLLNKILHPLLFQKLR